MTRPASGWLAAQLPEALSSQSFVRNFLAIFEDVTDGVRDRIQGLEHHLDLRLAPEDDLAWLASWLGRDVEGLPTARRRRVIAVAGRELPWRGTARWLRRLLAAYTGGEVEVTDTGGVHLPDEWSPHRRIVTVRLTDTGGLSARQLDRLIRRELPVDAELDLRLPGDDAEWLPTYTGSGQEPPRADTGPFFVELECEAPTLTRDRPLRCWLYLHNRTDRSDEYTVIGVDAAADWVADTPLVVPVAAGQERQLPIEIAVPPDADLPPGQYGVGLQVTSSVPGTPPETRRLTLTLAEEP